MANQQVIVLYKALIREAKKLPAYNFRNYALRRIRDSFKENRIIKEPAQVAAAIQEGKKSLELIKRQVIIGQIYDTEKLVIEYQK
ncbi:Complex 1 protein (LYR family) [Popillia japonica]|uniref:Complex 1 protein (LYR family) n=1 Tax=Popillia japonica TaxID=7064 RepID=A0AAW1MIH4_POPJA